MDIKPLIEDENIARGKWREYKDAAKKTRDPLYTDLKKVYNQIKNGKQVINIFDAVKAGGIRTENAHPRLAIAPAMHNTCYCRYSSDGTVFYSPFSHWPRRRNDKVIAQAIELKGCLPQIKVWALDLKAPIPIIPPRLRPAKLTDDYFILWEVDSWTVLPSRDPYLLRRITLEMFVICAAWDLTDIEMKVMEGRVRS